MSSGGKRDCVFLVADIQMEQVVRAFLSRERFELSLGCGAFDFDVIRDTIGKDPGVYRNAHRLLRPYEATHQHAVVMLDNAWDGSPGVAKIEEHITANLGSRWERYTVVVIDPELEVWVLQDSPHVSRAFRWRGEFSLREWLERNGHWPDGLAKPKDPKEAVRRIHRFTGKPGSSATFAEIVRSITIRGCTDPAFCKLKETLEGWFPGGAS